MAVPKILLIVDDSHVSRQILRNRFAKLRREWQIFDSDNGADAIAMIDTVRPDFITMDVNMPNMSGLEAAEKIHAAHPDIKIALITANIQPATQRRANDMGFFFVEKPIDDESIPTSLRFFESYSGHD